MGKYFRCVIGMCNNDMQCPELHKKHSNADGDIIIHILPKDGAVKAAWISAVFQCCKTVIQESLHSYETAFLPG